MTNPTYDFLWITRDRISVAHVTALSQSLEDLGGLDASAVRIICLRPGDGFTDPNGNVYREEELPAQGLLIQAI